MSLTHVDASGTARMVDVSEKRITPRRAVAEGRVIMSPDAFQQVKDASGRKGNVLGTAELAATMAAKRTSDLIPLCHQVPLDSVNVTTELMPEWPGVLVRATAHATARTGVEMEALVAVSVGCLTVYDMVKSADRAMRIEGIRVLEKTGGASGSWSAAGASDPFGKEAP